MVGSLELLLQPVGQGQGYVPGTGERALEWLHTIRCTCARQPTRGTWAP